MDISLIVDRGLPLLIASGVFVFVKLLRSQLVQSLLAMASPRLVWSAWPKPVCAAVVLAASAAGALVTASSQGQPLLPALLTAITAGVGAMGIDAGHGAIAEPAATTHNPAASIIEPLPLPNEPTPRA
jgi:hypothetical protein